jgi:radical SAM protein
LRFNFTVQEWENLLMNIPPTTRPSYIRSRKSFDLSPMLVFYELTRACDFICLHCRACAQTQPDPNELNTESSKRLIKQLAEFPEPPMLILTGGDPFKRDDIFEIIEYARSVGLDVSITPSATPLVTRTAIAQLRDAGISRVAISIDGADAATHEANRGVPGSFQRALDILDDARELGVQTQINTTLSPANVDQIEAMADRFASLDIRLWSVFFLIPVGRADQLPRLDGAECELAFERLWQQSKRQPFLIKTTEACHYRRYLMQHRVTHSRDLAELDEPRSRPFISAGVNDGKGVMFVSHTGVVHPSGFLPINCGSFPDQSVVDIYQNSSVFRSLRNSKLLHGKCGRCEYKNICGGSRARAFAVTGDLLAEEPDCIYQP